MGIDINTAEFLRSETRRGVRWGRTLSLGHQAVYMKADAYRSFIVSLGVSCRDTDFADDLFRGLGAMEFDIMDASDYEGANIVHDLNQPVKPQLAGIYDCVFDGGVLEHVFNFPLALKNCMEMVKTAGHFITITPMSAYCGHGFYQFSPELFYSALAAENGFSIERMLLVYRNRWYSVRSPAEVQTRIELLTREPTLLFVSSRRHEQKPIFAQWPQESDYYRAWSAKAYAETAPKKQPVKEFLLNINPLARKLQTHWRNYKRRRQCSLSNRAWFTPIHLDEE
jgi:hypothetical protein